MSRRMQPNNVTDALLSEHLKPIQAKLAEHDGQFLSIDSRLTALEGHVSAPVQRSVGRNVEIVDLVRRVERIECRLDPVDG